MSTIQHLRVHAISQSLFPATTLRLAVERMGFVQADPIRAPARAQDLILRHRVKGYRAGDLERRYAALNIEEDYLYAYGFVTKGVWGLLHPRDPVGLTELEKKVFDIVRGTGETHPAALESHLGRERVINAWGGYSKATTRALEHLHYRGLLRIARRDNGVRVYAAVASSIESLKPAERLRGLIILIAKILAPVPIQTLQANIARSRRFGSPRTALEELVRGGQLQKETIEGLTYVWPTRKISREVPRTVRFLSPFDPLVWDRRRFEHLWGWPYRFEAYTPPAKRIRGYYALPLLWEDDVIGWANASVIGGQLQVDVGFVRKQPRDAAFRAELSAEVERLRTFLNLSTPDSL